MKALGLIERVIHNSSRRPAELKAIGQVRDMNLSLSLMQCNKIKIKKKEESKINSSSSGVSYHDCYCASLKL